MIAKSISISTIGAPTGIPEIGTVDETILLSIKGTAVALLPVTVVGLGAAQVITGSSLSSTVTLKVHSSVFPAASVAVTVTNVIPTGNTLPEAGTLETVTPGQLSTAVGKNVTTALHSPGSLLAVISAGHESITGSSVSKTVTVKLQVAVNPELSVTKNVLVVVPTG